MKAILALAMMVSVLFSIYGGVEAAVEKVDCGVMSEIEKAKCEAQGYIGAQGKDGVVLQACHIYYYCLRNAANVYIAFPFKCQDDLDTSVELTKYFDPLAKKCMEVAKNHHNMYREKFEEK